MKAFKRISVEFTHELEVVANPRSSASCKSATQVLRSEREPSSFILLKRCETSGWFSRRSSALTSISANPLFCCCDSAMGKKARAAWGRDFFSPGWPDSPSLLSRARPLAARQDNTTVPLRGQPRYAHHPK